MLTCLTYCAEIAGSRHRTPHASLPHDGNHSSIIQTSLCNSKHSYHHYRLPFFFFFLTRNKVPWSSNYWQLPCVWLTGCYGGQQQHHSLHSQYRNTFPEPATLLHTRANRCLKKVSRICFLCSWVTARFSRLCSFISDTCSSRQLVFK